jgi:hypothetical protein
MVTGEFSREAVTTSITIPAESGGVNGTVKVVLPGAVAGTDKIIATATNDHAHKIMSVSGEYPNGTPYGTGSSNVKYYENATYTGTLVTDADGIIVTYTEEVARQQMFDVNGGVWTESSPDYEYLVDDLYGIFQDRIINNQYHPSDPTRAGKMFIGWTTNADIAAQTNFSSRSPVTWGSTTITPDAGDIVLDKIRREYLWDFTQPPSYIDTLYAVWSDTVTITFDYNYSGSKLHTWEGPSTSPQGPYVFYDSADGEISYMIAKGDRVPMPDNPTAYSEARTNGWSFIRWLVLNSTTDSYRSNSKVMSDSNLTTYAFDFAQHVMNDVTLVTSWTTYSPQYFTFLVENNVVGGSDNDEFLYTISVTEELVYGKIGGVNANREGLPDQRWGSVSTMLKNNQQYTVLVMVSYITNWGGAYGVEISVIDRNGVVIKHGQVIYCDKNTYLNFVSDYKYTLKISQEDKPGFATTVSVDQMDPSGSIVYSSDNTTRTFTFSVKQGTRANFTPVSNGYVGDAHNSLRVLFTNTGDTYIAPTDYHVNMRPFILLFGVGASLAMTAAVIKRKKRKEEE